VVTERYVLDRDQISLVFDGTGNQTHRYLYGDEIDQLLADEVGVSTRWMLADHQGTIKDVVDRNGAVLNHISYDSFGQVVSQTSSIELRFGYTGREWDTETGLDYYRARYYDPSVGRFISEDPLGFGGKDTNLIRYVKNSPTNWVDPSGKITFIIPGGFNEFGTLPDNLSVGARYPVIRLPNTPGFGPASDFSGNLRAAVAFAKIQLFLTVGGGLQDCEPINIIGHSDGTKVGNTVANSVKVFHPLTNIYLGRLDPTGVFRVPRFVAQSFDIASNAPLSLTPPDILATIWWRIFRPDYRVRFGVNHGDLIKDYEVVNYLKSVLVI
jgi:RHS repeat-associated protein